MLTELPLRDAPPWHFRLAKWMIRNRILGGYHLVELGEYMGWLNHLVRFRLGDGVSLDVPMNRRENQWALPDLLAYERPLVELLADKIAVLPQPVTWIDVGADIGALTALVLARSQDIAEVIAIEPNGDVQELLKRNLSRLPCSSRTLTVAIANFSGRGRLEDSLTLRSAHGRFLVPDDSGEIRVMRLDDLEVAAGGSLAIKIDVEGGELAVIRGARQLLENAPAWIVACEAHRDVFHRSRIDPCECVRLLFGLGATAAIVAESPEIHLDHEQPYFDQVPLRISNVVCCKRGRDQRS